MSGGRLPKNITFETLEGVVWRGQGGMEEKRAEFVYRDIRAFDIAWDRKETALEEVVWDETVTEGGRRVIAEWRK